MREFVEGVTMHKWDSPEAQARADGIAENDTLMPLLRYVLVCRENGHNACEMLEMLQGFTALLDEVARTQPMEQIDKDTWRVTGPEDWSKFDFWAQNEYETEVESDREGFGLPPLEPLVSEEEWLATLSPDARKAWLDPLEA